MEEDAEEFILELATPAASSACYSATDSEASFNEILRSHLNASFTPEALEKLRAPEEPTPTPPAPASPAPARARRGGKKVPLQLVTKPFSRSSPPAGSTGASPDWKVELQKQIHGRIKTTFKEQTGPSFDERIAKAAAKFQQEAKETEERQKLMIQEAKERAKARPLACPVRSKEATPKTPQERAEEHKLVIAENMKNYVRVSKERKRRMDTREPLFKVSEVEAAFEMQRQRQGERKRELREDEARRWKHIQELQSNVVHRPTLLEDYEKIVHLQSAPDIRLIPESAKETKMQLKLKHAISQKSFHETAWGKEVGNIRERQDARMRLHEIKYPPKQISEPPLPPRIMQPIDARMEAVIQQPWYQKSQWNCSVREMRERQRERAPLSEQ